VFVESATQTRFQKGITLIVRQHGRHTCGLPLNSKLRNGSDTQPIRTAARYVTICHYDKGDGVSAEPVSLQAVTAICGAFRDASAQITAGDFGTCLTPEPAKRPTFNARHFGIVIAVLCLTQECKHDNRRGEFLECLPRLQILSSAFVRYLSQNQKAGFIARLFARTQRNQMQSHLFIDGGQDNISIPLADEPDTVQCELSVRQYSAT
jgi:hypothetical protein